MSRPPGRSSLLNRAAARRYILDVAARLRPAWGCARVSAEALDDLEAALRARIRRLIESHPSGCGRTFRP